MLSKNMNLKRWIRRRQNYSSRPWLAHSLQIVDSLGVEKENSEMPVASWNYPLIYTYISVIGLLRDRYTWHRSVLFDFGLWHPSSFEFECELACSWIIVMRFCFSSFWQLFYFLIIELNICAVTQHVISFVCVCVYLLWWNTFHYTTLISRWAWSPLLLKHKIVERNLVKLFFRYKIIVLV